MKIGSVNGEVDVLSLGHDRNGASALKRRSGSPQTRQHVSALQEQMIPKHVLHIM